MGSPVSTTWTPAANAVSSAAACARGSAGNPARLGTKEDAGKPTALTGSPNQRVRARESASTSPAGGSAGRSSKRPARGACSASALNRAHDANDESSPPSPTCNGTRNHTAVVARPRNAALTQRAVAGPTPDAGAGSTTACSDRWAAHPSSWVRAATESEARDGSGESGSIQDEVRPTTCGLVGGGTVENEKKKNTHVGGWPTKKTSSTLSHLRRPGVRRQQQVRLRKRGRRLSVGGRTRRTPPRVGRRERRDDKVEARVARRVQAGHYVVAIHFGAGVARIGKVGALS